MRVVPPFMSGYQADGLINEVLNVMVARILDRGTKGPQEAYRARWGFREGIGDYYPRRSTRDYGFFGHEA